jgi:L,D-transpeptidase YcbB
MTSKVVWFIVGSSLALVALGPVAPPAAIAAAATQSLPNQIKSASSGKFRKFYKARSFLPIWARKGTIGPEADAFIAVLRASGQDGLDPADYAPDALKQAVDLARSGTPNMLGKAELKLSKAFYAYVRDIRAPRSDDDDIVYADKRLAPPKRLIPADVLTPLAIAPSLSDYIHGMEWMNPFYVDLRTAIADFHQRWGALPPVAIAQGATLKAGVAGDRVRLLRRRLGLPDQARFDKTVTARLKLFQAQHGLKASGIVDADTLAALNRDSVSYEAKMRLNLERARLLPPASVRQIVVNLASARLWMIDGKLSYADSMRVVVGAPDEKTPVMAGMVSYAILNPYWNVPTDLVQKRVAHRVLNGQSFTGLRYQALSDWSANATILPPESINWQDVADGKRELRVRMLPGGENFMGKVKFMLPNDLGIYLHDFPDKTVFDKPDRHISSGCIRLEQAAKFGQWLFNKPLQATSDAPEQVVSLPKPVPVYLTYLTVVPNKTSIAFLDDPYGRDGHASYASR